MAIQRRRTYLALTALAGAVLALAGCSGQASSGTAAAGTTEGAGSAAAGSPAVPGGVGSAAGSTGGGADAGAPAGAADVKALAPRVIRTAQVVVEVEGQLADAAARVRAVAGALRGAVSSETTTYADGAGQSVLVLRVPEPDLDRALALVTGEGGVGRELNRTTSAQDVTGDIADLESRVATQRASVARVRALLASAKSLSDVVLLESELSKREADLAAVEARRAALADQADLATLTVDLRTPAALPPPAAKQEPPFLRGLHSGWDAVTASTTVVVTVLGALLPVAVVAALVGGPVLWVLRRRRAGARTPAPVPDVP